MGCFKLVLIHDHRKSGMKKDFSLFDKFKRQIHDKFFFIDILPTNNRCCVLFLSENGKVGHLVARNVEEKRTVLKLSIDAPQELQPRIT